MGTGVGSEGGADAALLNAIRKLSFAVENLQVTQRRVSYILGEDGQRLKTEDGSGFLLTEVSGQPNPWAMTLYDADGNPITAANRLPVRDDFDSIEHEDDQTGAGAVLTFTLSTPGDFVMVDVDNTGSTDYTTYRARATVDGSVPSAASGFVCRSGTTSYLPFPMSGNDVQVYAPTGTVVAVQVGKHG